MSSVSKRNQRKKLTFKISLIKLPYITCRAHPSVDTAMRKRLRTRMKSMQHAAMYGAGATKLMSMKLKGM